MKTTFLQSGRKPASFSVRQPFLKRAPTSNNRFTGFHRQTELSSALRWWESSECEQREAVRQIMTDWHRQTHRTLCQTAFTVSYGCFGSDFIAEILERQHRMLYRVSPSLLWMSLSRMLLSSSVTNEPFYLWKVWNRCFWSIPPLSQSAVAPVLRCLNVLLEQIQNKTIFTKIYKADMVKH